MPLLDRDLIRNELLRDASWAWSHAADGEFLGMGLVYYTITYALRARLAVCLGSGGGFVPRLMRQAQRDAGIATESRTILVDANLPSAGWGSPTWLAPDSFFRQHFADVEVTLQSTTDAARILFAARGPVIDYLHIDANHSFAACLEDFSTYRPLLRPGALVTLHDTNWPGAGVGQVVEYLRTRADCEVIDLPEQGAGTALVKVLGTPGKSVPVTSERLRVERREEARLCEPGGMGWAYLESAAFQSRSALAAHFVRNCQSVVEIGGGKTPIDRFAFGIVRDIVVVDPFIRESVSNGGDGLPTVRHLRARFQELDFHCSPDTDLGVVMLGFELQGMEDADWCRLIELVDAARVCVVEFPTSWDMSRNQFAHLRAQTSLRETFQCKLDLSGNDVGDLSNSWPPRFDREFHVLER